MSASNILVISQVVLGIATKLQDAANLLAISQFENRDVTDAEVDGTSLKRDVQIAKAQAAIDGPGADLPGRE